MNSNPIRLRPVVLVLVLMTSLRSWCVTVENFSLLDQNGTQHELYGYANSKAVVLMVQGNGCPIVRNALGDIKAVRELAQGTAFQGQDLSPFTSKINFVHDALNCD